MLLVVQASRETHYPLYARSVLTALTYLRFFPAHRLPWQLGWKYSVHGLNTYNRTETFQYHRIAGMSLNPTHQLRRLIFAGSGDTEANNAIPVY